MATPKLDTYTAMHTHAHTHLHMLIGAHTHAHTRTHTHTQTHTYTHKHTHTLTTCAKGAVAASKLCTRLVLGPHRSVQGGAPGRSTVWPEDVQHACFTMCVVAVQMCVRVLCVCLCVCVCVCVCVYTGGKHVCMNFCMYENICHAVCKVR